MGRPSDYTPDEDTIILSVIPLDECRQALIDAGFKERTTAAISSRRQHLRAGGALDVPLERLRGTPWEWDVLTEQRKALGQAEDEIAEDYDRRLTELDDEFAKRRARLSSRIEEVNERIRELLDEG